MNALDALIDGRCFFGGLRYGLEGQGAHGSLRAT
jgi:hypothetical protein